APPPRTPRQAARHRTRPAPRAPRPVRVGKPGQRCLGLLLVLAVAFAAVVARLVDLQVVAPERYAAAGIAQRLRTVPLTAERGSIFDRTGQELAMSVAQKTIWANPALIDDKKAAATALAPLLGMEAQDVRAKLAGDATFVYLARQIPLEAAAKVEALKLDGVGIVDESKRFLPKGLLAKSVLGGVDIDSKGISGLEKQYQASLIGTPGELQIEKAPGNRTIAGGRQHVTPAVRGNDLVLTIDQSLQYEVERALADAMRTNTAKHASAIVSDPTTGEILAMANMGRDEAGNPVPIGENRALITVFEPGSVNKVITMSGALEEGIYAPDSVLNVPDTLALPTHTFSEHEFHGPQNWTLTDILTQSSNVGTIKIALKLGPTKVKEYLKRFGLGLPTGLAFPQQTDGIINYGHWNATDIGSVPIGQGVGVNALQMLQVFNTLANGGVWIEPHLVKEVVGPKGAQATLAAPKQRRVVSERTAKEMTAMMANVVDRGTGMPAQIKGYTVAGKTGTARKVIDGQYQKGAYVSSFAGFVPAEAPRLSAIVVFDEPHPYYAAQVAAPVFARIGQYGLRQFKIPAPAKGLGVVVPKAAVANPNQID
ncbi:MAG: Cell division protein FtsI, partial [Actinomycetia bacterium]|nr:Cell division protein FtsI [Actinomycetes bacterium]